MINAVQQNNWNLQLKLNPASLGEINVALEFNEGNLEGKLCFHLQWMLQGTTAGKLI